MPKVSVIIPVYNVEKYLRQCLDSVVNQTLKDIEIICIDDGSTDNSLNILKEYAAKDSRVKLIIQKNQGVSAARNQGLRAISGEYYLFIDSDDWIDEQMLENMYNKAIDDSVDLVICKYYDCFKYIRRESNFPFYVINTPPFYFDKCHEDFYYSHTGALCKLYKNTKNQMFNENLKLGEDTVFYWQYCLSNNPKISIINKPFYFYRQHPHSAMRNVKLVIENKLINSIEYLVSQNCFKKASQYTQAHVLDRFASSICYQIDEILKGEKIPSSYIKKLDMFMKKFKNFDTNILANLRFYRLLGKKINNCKWRPYKTFIHNVFSVYNENFHKVVCILGLKIKLKTKNDKSIDMVYLWCDGNDKEFQNQKTNLQKNFGYKVTLQAVSDCRYIDNDELKYSLRSLEKYANWIDKIYIVTNGQCPEWLNINNPRVKLIKHSQIMPKEALPNFNSSAIELCIKNITDLNEYFLYGNDDCFFFDHVTPDFFFKNNKPIYRFMGKYNKNINVDLYVNLLLNAENLIYKKYKKKYDRWPHHNIDPYKKSAMEKCYKQFKKEIDRTILHPFRDSSDITKTIYANHALATKQAIHRNLTKQKKYESMYIAAHDKNILWELIHNNPKLVCINDDEITTDEDRQKSRQILEILFPNKSSFEK